jgi:hypothetical protein
VRARVLRHSGRVCSREEAVLLPRNLGTDVVGAVRVRHGKPLLRKDAARQDQAIRNRAGTQVDDRAGLDAARQCERRTNASRLVGGRQQAENC